MFKFLAIKRLSGGPIMPHNRELLFRKKGTTCTYPSNPQPLLLLSGSQEMCFVFPVITIEAKTATWATTAIAKSFTLLLH
jgi:hypothetical protein